MSNPLLLQRMLTNKSKKAFVLILIAILIFTSFVTATDGGDFDTYLDASQKLHAGFNIYAPPFIKGLQYYYSPFFAWILTPFKNQFFFTEVGWSVLSYILLGRSLILLFRYFDLSLLSKQQQNLWMLTTVFMALQFILYEVSLIQVTFFLLWAIFESLHQIEKGRHVLGGFIVGFAIIIKLMPLVLLPYLLFRGYFKSIVYVVLTVFILLMLPAFTIGFSYNNFLLIEWWHVINPMQHTNLFETGIGTHSMTALVPVYLTHTVGDLAYKRNFLDLNHQTIELIINISRFVLLGISLFYFKSKPFRKEPDRLKTFWEIAYFMLLIPLLLPHQQKYDFLFVIPMISYLVYFFISINENRNKASTRIVFYTFIASIIVFSPIYGSSIIGKFLFDYTQHYRLLTLCTLLLIPISLYCSPNKVFRIAKKQTLSDTYST